MLRPLALRAAAVVSLLLTLAHTRGFQRPGPDPAQFATRKLMEASPFHVMDQMRTYWDLYVGFGLIISALMFMQAALLWFVADAEKRHPGEQRAMIATLLAGNVAVAALDWRYLFIAPVVGGVLIVLATGLALAPHRPGSSAVQPAQA